LLGSCPRCRQELPATARVMRASAGNPPGGILSISPRGKSCASGQADHRRTCATRDEPFALLGEHDASLRSGRAALQRLLDCPVRPSSPGRSRALRRDAVPENGRYPGRQRDGQRDYVRMDARALTFWSPRAEFTNSASRSCWGSQGVHELLAVTLESTPLIFVASMSKCELPCAVSWLNRLPLPHRVMMPYSSAPAVVLVTVS
jgi:hypothetical protein